jgi:hypothetical protein
VSADQPEAKEELLLQWNEITDHWEAGLSYNDLALVSVCWLFDVGTSGLGEL